MDVYVIGQAVHPGITGLALGAARVASDYGDLALCVSGAREGCVTDFHYGLA